jgi:uncharacterized membrane protein YebE (DUF533 family)
MLLKLAALGAIGYAGYKYYEKNKDSFRMGSSKRSQPALAGGPLSSQAHVQDSPDITNG